MSSPTRLAAPHGSHTRRMPTCDGPRLMLYIGVSSVVEDFRDPPFFRSSYCPQPGLDSWHGSGINRAYD
jgi:hypothetical protein